MSTPPFFLGACLAFWGWETGWLAVALPLALVLEATRWHTWRWEFSDEDFQRIWNICALLFVGAFLLRLTNREVSLNGFAFFQWQPFLFAPMMLVQAHSARAKIPAATFSWLLRWRSRGPEPGAAWNVAYPYAGLCLLAAAATNRRDSEFYVIACVLAVWAVWDSRSRRFSMLAWALTLGVAIALGFLGQSLLTQGQAMLENQFASLLARWSRHSGDFGISHTAMGTIGAMKQSGRIVLRVRPESGPFPTLLRRASYNDLNDTVWKASEHRIAYLPAEDDLTTWVIRSNPPSLGAASIFAQFPRRQGLLPVPEGIARIENLPVGSVETNSLGFFVVKETPGLLKYRVLFGGGPGIDDPPDKGDEFDDGIDLSVPAKERPAILQALTEIHATGDDQAKLLAVARYFQSRFEYKTFVPENARGYHKGETPISRFLTKTRAGHCEYFASATVLLLREMGIPARYATGYAVMEKAKWGKTFLVRERHAHAWVLAWVNGFWQDFDTTPASWGPEEDKNASSMEPVTDLWSEFGFLFARWRWLGNRDLFGRVAPWLIGPLVLILSWRVFARRRRGNRPGEMEAEPELARNGIDSEFYRIEERLALLGLARQPAETWSNWLRRVEAAGAAAPQGGELPPLVELHSRYRFARGGLSADEREHLQRAARAWLEAFSRPGPARPPAR
ncbi:MAG TPA: transglutaminase domain-containing protein [Verrucomicrobiae bacterium]|nr:transglutaminase domain-containing protein [Verrucomicrobiae bacterium]